MISIYQEKRNSIRVRSIHLLSYSTINRDRSFREIGMARTLNVSEKGILMESYSPLSESAELEIVFNVIDECISARGKVIRIDEDEEGRYRVAVNFTHISREGFTKLNNYLNNSYSYTRFH